MKFGSNCHRSKDKICAIGQKRKQNMGKNENKETKSKAKPNNNAIKKSLKLNHVPIVVIYKHQTIFTFVIFFIIHVFTY